MSNEKTTRNKFSAWRVFSLKKHCKIIPVIRNNRCACLMRIGRSRMNCMRHYRREEIIPLNPLLGGVGVGKVRILDNVY